MNAKETITLAELRQTELYRREQTRPLREFLMENIDVLKLADEVEMWGRDLLALNMKGGVPVIEGARLIRQQQAEIEALKQTIDANNLSQNIGQFVRPANELVALVNNMCNDSIDWKVDPLTLEEGTPLYTYEQITASGFLSASEPIYPSKTLTDEEIYLLAEEYNLKWSGYMDLVIRFARAILRKAQKK
jgi:hypothetical protein